MLTSEDVYKFIDSFDRSGLNISSVAAQTGTGKSTVFPRGFYEKGKTMMVIQPTITASMGLASYMRTQVPSFEIGTAVEGDIKYKNNLLYPHHDVTTPIVYCTAGHLRNLLLRFGENKQPIPFVDYIFLDEAHTGDLQYDMIMYMYRYLSILLKEKSSEETNYRDQKLGLPKLILVTATPGVYPFKKEEIFLASYPGKSSLVKILYHNRNYENLTGGSYNALFSDTVEIVKKKHEENPVQEDETDGWLVFCPGKQEILTIVKRLINETKGTIIIPLYSSMTEESEISYNDSPPPGFRKIIVSTNVAEASITIDGLSGVFDTLVEKTTVSGKSGGIMLIKTHISKSSAQQRKGRAGRTGSREGFCYRMCSESFFNKKIPDSRLREIERISSDGLILDIVSRNLHVEEVIHDGVVSKKVLEETKKRLSSIGLLTQDGSHVTLAGEFAKNTPLSPRMAMFFWLWAFHGEFNIYIGAIITAVIETYSQGFFYFGEKDIPDEILKTKYSHVINRLNEMEESTPLRFNIEVILSIIASFKSFDIPGGLLAKYCVENNLNNQKVKECFKLIKYLVGKKHRSSPLEIGIFSVENEIKRATPFLYQCYEDLLFKTGSSKYLLRDEFSFIKKKNSKNNRKICEIIPLSFFETGSGTMQVSLYETACSEPLARISPPLYIPRERHQPEIIEKEKEVDLENMILENEIITTNLSARQKKTFIPEIKTSVINSQRKSLLFSRD